MTPYEARPSRELVADPPPPSCSPGSGASISHSIAPVSTWSGATSGSPRPRPSTRSIATRGTSANGDFQTYGAAAGLRPASTDLGLPEHVAVNEDIAKVLDQYESRGQRGRQRPAFQSSLTSTSWSVGFPCQDYSVAKTLSQAHGCGQEGRAVVGDPPAARSKLARPPIKYLFLENVDRLLKSPSGSAVATSP